MVRRTRRTVYLAQDPVRQRPVVVKRYDNWRDAVTERNVMRSYGASPYLVRLYRSYIRNRRGYIEMEYVRGRTINEMISQRGPIPPDQVVTVALNILAALDVLHRRRLVHGDLHGGNVIVTNMATGEVKIIDLQHAVRLNRLGRARAKRTLPTPPPELAPESRRPYIDQRFDIYGVGYICACMLAGKRLRSMSEVAAGGSDATSLWNVVRRAMDPDPRKRYPSARAMMRKLQMIRKEAAAGLTPTVAVTIAGGNR